MTEANQVETTPNPSDRPLVEVENVSMRFGQQPVLRNVDFDVPRGQTVAIIGPSGCGKTVLLKLIVALLRPTSGRVLFDGRVLADLRERELTKQRLRIGFLFQGAALFDSMTVFDNVAFPLREHTDKSEDEIRREVHQRLQEVGLRPEDGNKSPAELSGGMKKRVGLARAVILDPELMLYDEPTTGLDPIMSETINQLVLQTKLRRGITSIVVTHDMNTVRTVADRVLMLQPLAELPADQPQLIFDGSVASLQTAEDPRIRRFVFGMRGLQPTVVTATAGAEETARATGR